MSRTGKDEFIARALVDLVVHPTRTAEDIHARLHRSWARTRTRDDLHDDEAEPLCADAAALKAVILGRLSTTTIAVRWSDSRSGVYGEQTWRIGRACRYAHCAATGRHIHPRDFVFKPALIHRKSPFNGNRMILASAVDSDVSGCDG
jgi:hypothetical protein